MKQVHFLQRYYSLSYILPYNIGHGIQHNSIQIQEGEWKSPLTVVLTADLNQMDTEPVPPPPLLHFLHANGVTVILSAEFDRSAKMSLVRLPYLYSHFGEVRQHHFWSIFAASACLFQELQEHASACFTTNFPQKKAS